MPIYPAQTSMMTIQIALARFLEQGGDILGNYPYWYLGTTPYRYLTGPILPFLLAGIHQALPQLSLFTIFYLLITLTWLLGAGGVYLLIRELRGKRLSAVLAALLYLFGPVIPLTFRFSNGLSLIAFSFLPFILALYSRFLKGWSRKLTALLSLAITFLFLLDSLVIPTMVLGMAAVFLSQVGWKKPEEKIKRTLVPIAYCLILATLWYTPGYWLALLGAPSLAGKGLGEVMIWLGKLLPTIIAFSVALVSVKFFKKKNQLRDFCFYWLLVFLCLSLLRFLADPDFWLDWIAYGTEIQFGLAIALALIVPALFSKLFTLRYSLFAIIFAYCLMPIAWLFLFNQYVLSTLQTDITQTVEYRISKQLSETADPGERVFLSGTTAFWLNAFPASWRIPQVRGGVDQASIDPEWRRATWEIREGVDLEKTLEWLKKLRVAYVVVHTPDSEEFYHDFVYPEKFEGGEGLEKIYDQNGDRIYRVMN